MNKKLINSVAFDAVCAALFIAWQVFEVQGAGNLLLFIIWALSMICILASLAAPTEPAEERSAAHAAWSTASDVLFIAAFAWVGYILTAVVYLLAALFTHAHRLASYKLREGGNE